MYNKGIGGVFMLKRMLVAGKQLIIQPTNLYELDHTYALPLQNKDIRSPFTIIFRLEEKSEFKDGDSYQIKIEGLRTTLDKPTVFSYDTTFF